MGGFGAWRSERGAKGWLSWGAESELDWFVDIPPK